MFKCENVAFIAAVFSASGDLINNIAITEFGWTERPLLDKIEPVSGPPGKLLRLTGRGFNLASGELRVVLSGYEFPVFSTSIDAAGNDVIISVIPPLSAGAHSIALLTGAMRSNELTLDITEMEPTGKPVGQVIEEVCEGMDIKYDSRSNSRSRVIRIDTRRGYS